MQLCRVRVHHWGGINRVAFDPGKEHIVVLHPRDGSGDPFKLLGLMVDVKLLMNQAIEKILSQIRLKIKAILRTKPYYSVKELVGQFKTHIWGIIEIHNEGIFQVSESLLKKLANVQHSFLDELGIEAEEAFLKFNFAPPVLRRNIGVLGLLQKRVLGLAHPIFHELLPYHVHVFGSPRAGEHTRQLYGHILKVKFQQALHNRSIFAMVYVYNRLPQEVMDTVNV